MCMIAVWCPYMLLGQLTATTITHNVYGRSYKLLIRIDFFHQFSVYTYAYIVLFNHSNTYIEWQRTHAICVQHAFAIPHYFSYLRLKTLYLFITYIHILTAGALCCAFFFLIFLSFDSDESYRVRLIWMRCGLSLFHMCFHACMRCMMDCCWC